ncbi:hypothetical protein [Fictibacillus sp. NRS-1165]|uniref:hypothetical protein n=1 Tax=Fictibacillus sp. NRS-1165 TaxID=3144463 RepID=UPI003D2464E1
MKIENIRNEVLMIDSGAIVTMSLPEKLLIGSALHYRLIDLEKWLDENRDQAERYGVDLMDQECEVEEIRQMIKELEYDKIIEEMNRQKGKSPQNKE